MLGKYMLRRSTECGFRSMYSVPLAVILNCSYWYGEETVDGRHARNSEGQGTTNIRLRFPPLAASAITRNS
jgi:hypothetical protein